MGESNVKSYILYAVGEIVLVVIGILIAIQIDNWNEKQKEIEKIDGYFNQALTELSNDLIEAQNVVNYYEMKDSLISRMLNDSVTPQEYRSNLQYQVINTTLRNFKMNDAGYQNLIHSRDYLPDDYTDIYNRLERIFNYREGLENVNNLILKDVEFQLKDVREKYDWYSTLEVEDEEVEYHLKNPIFRNRLFNFQSLGAGNVVGILRQYMRTNVITATLIAEKINVPPPAPIATYFVTPDSTVLSRYVGSYQSGRMRMRFTQRNDTLFRHFNNQRHPMRATQPHIFIISGIAQHIFNPDSTMRLKIPMQRQMLVLKRETGK